MRANIGYSDISTFEYACTCFVIAGVVWIFTLYQPTTYAIEQPINMNCPSLVIRHGVDGKMKTFTRVVDACSEHLLPGAYQNLR